MRLLGRVVEGMALVLLVLGGLGTGAAMFLGTSDVVGTQFAGWPVPGATELTESVMVLIVFGGLAYVQVRRGHIRVELVYTHVGPRGRAIMDVVTHLAALVFFGILVWESTGEAVTSWRIREAAQGIVRVPLYPARWSLVVGAGLLMVQLVLDLYRDVQRVRGKEAFEVPGVVPAIPEIPLRQDD